MFNRHSIALTVRVFALAVRRTCSCAFFLYTYASFIYFAPIAIRLHGNSMLIPILPLFYVLFNIAHCTYYSHGCDHYMRSFAQNFTYPHINRHQAATIAQRTMFVCLFVASYMKHACAQYLRGAMPNNNLDALRGGGYGKNKRNKCKNIIAAS